MPLPTDAAELSPFLSEEFSRAGGPGGQNVNKVSSRVTLRFAFEACPLLRESERELIRRRLTRRIGSDGTLRVTVDSDRSQLVNRQTAVERLIALLTAALHVERPRTATRPTLGSKRRRVGDKRRRGEIKQSRRLRSDE